MNIANDEAVDLKLIFNKDKSKYMVFKPPERNKFSNDERLLDTVTSFKYLGLWQCTRTCTVMDICTVRVFKFALAVHLKSSFQTDPHFR